MDLTSKVEMHHCGYINVHYSNDNALRYNVRSSSSLDTLRAVKFASLRIDVNSGSSGIVCCEATSPKWTEWQGEMAGNLVSILNRMNFNKCAAY